MGCDAYANKSGVFEIKVRNYEDLNPNVLDFQRVIRVEGLNPEQKIFIEITEGRDR